MEIKNLLAASLLTVSSLFASKPAESLPIGMIPYTVKNNTNYSNPVMFRFYRGNEHYRLNKDHIIKLASSRDASLVWYQDGQLRSCYIRSALGNKYKNIELFHNSRTGLMECKGTDAIRRVAAKPKPTKRKLLPKRRVWVENHTGQDLVAVHGDQSLTIKKEGVFYLSPEEDRFLFAYDGPTDDSTFMRAVCPTEKAEFFNVLKVHVDSEWGVDCRWHLGGHQSPVAPKPKPEPWPAALDNCIQTIEWNGYTGLTSLEMGKLTCKYRLGMLKDASELRAAKKQAAELCKPVVDKHQKHRGNLQACIEDIFS